MQEFRPRLSQEEYDVIKSLRSKHTALEAECEEKGIPVDDVKTYWYKGKHFSINVKSPTTTYIDVKDIIVAEMLKHAPAYKTFKRENVQDPHLLVIDPADVHIGKLAMATETGEDYNISIALDRVISGVESLIGKCSGFKIDKVLYIIGNDILHTDNTKRTTTGGTAQDTEGMWHSNFLVAKKLHVAVIERLMTIADVCVQYDPSNHDYMTGFFLADTLSSWFANCKHVTFNATISHRKYFRYHNNLIGTTHGDGAKEADLPMLMAHETGSDWAECKHKYFYTHHIHHKKSKDYMGVTVESMRSPSGPDSWHASHGYLHAPKAIEAFIHHPKDGQVARLTNVF